MNKITLFIIPVLFCFWSCGSQKVVTTKYYVIEFPVDNVRDAIDTIPLMIEQYCEIVPVDVNPAYSTTQIANRSSTRAITYYSYHQWAIRPAESFSRLIVDYFMHVPVFAGVSDRFWRVQPDFHLETTIYRMEVVQEQSTFSAHLDLEFRLREVKRGREILHHRADRYITLYNRDLNLFASAIGDIFYQELQKLSEKIVMEIKDSP